MEKASKMNVFRGRDTRCEGAKSNSDGKKGVDVKVSALFLYLNAIGIKTLWRFFAPIVKRQSLKTVSKGVENPPLSSLQRLNDSRPYHFPFEMPTRMRRRENRKKNTFQTTGKEVPNMAVC